MTDLVAKSQVDRVERSDSNKIIPPANRDEFLEGFPQYTFEVLADIVLAILLGITVNKLTNHIAKYLGLNKYAKLVVQLVLIIIVLYIMKIDSKYLYASWKGETSYGIVFTTVFFAIQKNLTSFVEDIYTEDE